MLHICLLIYLFNILAIYLFSFWLLHSVIYLFNLFSFIYFIRCALICAIYVFEKNIYTYLSTFTIPSYVTYLSMFLKLYTYKYIFLFI